MSRDWLDSEGRLLFGRYKGKYAEDVARDNAGYMRWLASECEDVSDEDRRILTILLERVHG